MVGLLTDLNLRVSSQQPGDTGTGRPWLLPQFYHYPYWAWQARWAEPGEGSVGPGSAEPQDELGSEADRVICSPCCL